MVRRTSTLSRVAYGSIGVFLTIVGFIGVVTPVLPGTVFLILALACFSRSSPKLESWLLNHKLVGPSLRQWQDTGAIRRRTKFLIAVMILLMTAGSAIRFENRVFGVIFALLGLSGILYVLSRPTLEYVLKQRASQAIIGGEQL